MSKSQDSAYKAHIKPVIDHLQILLKMTDWEVCFLLDGEHSRDLDKDETEAEADINTDYKQVSIYFGSLCRRYHDIGNIRLLYAVVLHELIHCILNEPITLLAHMIQPNLGPQVTRMQEQQTVHFERILMELIPPINYDPTRKSGKVGIVKGPVVKPKSKKVVK